MNDVTLTMMVNDGGRWNSVATFGPQAFDSITEGMIDLWLAEGGAVVVCDAVTGEELDV